MAKMIDWQHAKGARPDDGEDHGLVVGPGNGIIHRVVDPADCRYCIPLDLSASSAELRKLVAEWRMTT